MRCTPKFILVFALLQMLFVVICSSRTHAADVSACVDEYREFARLYPDSFAFYQKVLPDSGMIKFEKSELETLYRFRERALGPDAKTTIQSADEARLVQGILKTPVKVGDSFSQKQIDETVLLRAFKRLAYKEAYERKRKNPAADIDDLLQEAMSSLMTSIKKYKSTDEVMFSTTATRPMRSAMDEVTRQSSQGAPLADSDGLLRTSRAYLRTGYYLKRKLKRSPTATEIADEYNRVHGGSVQPDTILKAIEQRNYAARITSETTTEARTGDAIAQSGGPTVHDAIDLALDDKPLVDAVLEAKEREAVLAKMMMTGLDQRERKILGEYVGVHAEVHDGVYTIRESDGATLEEVAGNYSISANRVRQIVIKAERKIKWQIIGNPEYVDLFRDSIYYQDRARSVNGVHPFDRPLMFLGD